jgi:outer membrane protein
VVGQNPGDLEPEPPLPGVPTDIDEAFDVAQVENAAIRSAAFAEEASRSRIAQARSELRPTVGLRAQYGYGGPVVPFDIRDVDRTFSASAVVSQPLYAGGLRRSRIRQATEQNNADLIEIEGERRDVLRSVSQAFNQVLAARGNITSQLEQVRANRIAAEGVREEAAVGLRTTIEVLNAEQELRNSELLLVNARRDDYVAAASLLSAMGRLEARNLIAQVDLYDPAVNFDRVKGKGGVPWEPLVERLDNIAAPVPAERPATQPIMSGETVATAR